MVLHVMAVLVLLPESSEPLSSASRSLSLPSSSCMLLAKQRTRRKSRHVKTMANERGRETSNLNNALSNEHAAGFARPLFA